VIICVLFFASYFSLNAVFIDNSTKDFDNENSIVEVEKGEQAPLTSQYTIVNPINISSAGDWATYSFITGNGSEINPYIIEDIEIQGNGVKTSDEIGPGHLNYTDAGIYINAAGNCTIRNCRISSISLGVYLDFGAATMDAHNIQEVEIDNCGVGIFVFGIGSGGQIKVNISRCDISNCNWVTVKVPINLFTSHYGGFGMWVKGDEGSVIEFCKVQNCSIGIFSSAITALNSNQLINCGFLFDFMYIFSYITMFNNTINGKPLGLFLGENNLVLSGQQALQYGQLIFAACHYLHLSNFQIEESCSFGLMLHYCNNPVLEDILCENQEIGFFIYSDYMTADNLDVKNCNAGFWFLRLRHSTLNQLSMENIDIPVYAEIPISNTTIGIEKSARFYLNDYFNVEDVQINTSVSSIMIPRSNLSEFGIEGFIFDLNETDTYRVYGFDPVHSIYYYDFTIIIYAPSAGLAIPGFPLIWFYAAILFSISFLKFSMRHKNDKRK
jgi:parallel beta-helix repeat protein